MSLWVCGDERQVRPVRVVLFLSHLSFQQHRCSSWTDTWLPQGSRQEKDKQAILFSDRSLAVTAEETEWMLRGL